MRLLKRSPDGKISLESFKSLDHFRSTTSSRYAVLSHTWVEGQEITYQEFLNSNGHDSKGYEKIQFCVNQAAADGIEYSWIDTCCINKESLPELTTAINSMFSWYKSAARCYVCLPDVEVPPDVTDPSAYKITWIHAYKRSRWFTRGWTLQELLAPPIVDFFSKEGKKLGSKISLEKEIHETTRIPLSALRDPDLGQFSVEERFRWIEGRSTTVPEDKAYCLFGIFNIFLPLIYAEGEEHALQRVRDEVNRRQLDLATQTLADIKLSEPIRGTLPNQPNRNGIAAVDDSDLPSRNVANAVAGSMYGSDKASHNVPFPRDRDFIQRPDLTDQITAALAIPQARLALVGVGGVGKSQIAINYCYHVRDESPRTWVFWIHASNAARYSQGVRDCLDLADVDKRSDPQVNIHELFRNWLRSRDSGRWLIVIDNADEIDFLVERSNGQTPLFKHLPPCNHGTILITSRSKISALKLVEPKEIVEIPPMGEQQAIALIEKQLGPNSGIQRLARALDYMPLAMSQAAAYIKNRGKRFSIERYIEKLQKGDQSKRSILDEELGDLRRDDEARNAIALTWQISFEHIRRLRRSAADLLSLMSFCDRQAIPENLLKVKRESRQDEKIPDGNHSDDYIDDMSSDASSDDGSDTSQDDGFEKDVIMLEGFAFISITTAEESTYEMHRLVQRATQRWLQSQKQFEHWRAAFLYNLADIHPSGEYENWKECQTLRPHVRAALDLNVMHRDELLDLASTCFKAGWYAYQMHLDSEAAEMYTRAYAISCQERGEDHDGSLGIVNDLALVRLRQGRLAEAEKLQKKVLKTRALSLEAEHPRMLMSMHNLALTYSYQERWGEAEELLAKVLETKYVVFGKQHRDTLLSMYDLAYLFQRQKRWTEAEELTVEVLEIRRRMLGADHPDTLDSMADLAAMYRGREQWEKAEELYVKTVEARQRVLGSAHNSTSASMAALSRIYYKQNRWAEAEQMLSKVVETRTKFEGAEHIDTLFDMHELAYIYMVLERWEEAASLLEKVVEARQRVLGPQHKNTLISMSKLSDVYYEQNRWAEAALLRAKEVETRAKSQGEEDEETLFAMHELAVIYVAQERWKEAESLLEKVVETRQRVLGPEHKNTLISMSKLADIYCKQCRWAEAASLRAKEVEIRVRVQGAENEDTLFAMHELAVVYRAQSRQPEARELLVKVVDARSRVLGPEHPDTLESRIRLSDVSSESSQ